MDNSPVTARSLGPTYHINADRFERVYKERLSGFREWEERAHCEDWLVRADNVGPYLSIDETALSRGEVYTILSNRRARGHKGSIVAIVKGVRKEDVVSALKNIPESVREKVVEVTLDLSSGMHSIVKESFPRAELVLDRFHVQQLLGEAIQETRLHYKRQARMKEVDAMEEHKAALLRREQRRRERARDTSGRRGRKRKRLNEAYRAGRLENGDTRVELLTRSRYLLMCPAHKWTPSQKQRAEILFRLYPQLERAYSLTHSFRMIFNNSRATKVSAMESLRRWYCNAADFDNKPYQVALATIYEHQDEITNFFNRRSTNAYAESLNAKIKDFRARLRGVVDVPFFLYRLMLIYA